MPTVNIYRAGEKIDSKEFQRDFVVVEQEGGEFIWRADGEPASKRGHTILIWIRVAMQPPEAHFIPPGWKLIIDGVTVVKDSTDSASRLEIPITGKTAELQHNDLSFVIRFPVR